MMISRNRHCNSSYFHYVERIVLGFVFNSLSPQIKMHGNKQYGKGAIPYREITCHPISKFTNHTIGRKFVRMDNTYIGK